jgi:phytoene synthase
MSDPLTASYSYCRRLTRRAAGNFGYAFWALPADQRQAMQVLYAFLRLTDDIGDDPAIVPAVRQENLRRWSEDLHAVLAGESRVHPVWPALAETVRRFEIPPEHLTAVIEGVAMDLAPRRFRTFDELSEYCYHVAGAVGLCCLRIWGCRDPAAEPLAIDCGLAFQLTNILRDLREDVAAGRVYLPLEDLERFGYSERDLAAHRRTAEFRRLMAFESERAWNYYRRAEALSGYLAPAGRKVLRIMREIYGGLLTEIERRDFDVFRGRVRLPPWRKAWIATRTLCGTETSSMRR